MDEAEFQQFGGAMNLMKTYFKNIVFSAAVLAAACSSRAANVYAINGIINIDGTWKAEFDGAIGCRGGGEKFFVKRRAVLRGADAEFFWQIAVADEIEQF